MRALVCVRARDCARESVWLCARACVHIGLRARTHTAGVRAGMSVRMCARAAGGACVCVCARALSVCACVCVCARRCGCVVVWVWV